MWSFDGIRSLDQALQFAKAKGFDDSADDTKTLPFWHWTGNIEVKFYEIIEIGETETRRQPFQNTWDGGDVGFMMGPAELEKGVMSTQGNITKTGPNNTAAIFLEGRELASIKLHYCSTVGLIYAGILGPVIPMLLARKTNEHKRGAAQVVADVTNMPPPKKVRYVPEIDGLPFGLPLEYNLFDLTSLDGEKDD